VAETGFAPGFTKPRWDLGDFDYNGFVDNDDVTLLGVYYNPSALPIPSPSEGDGVAAVPEPATVVMLWSGLIAILLPHWARRQPRDNYSSFAPLRQEPVDIV
jgi:hypothetical protein